MARKLAAALVLVAVAGCGAEPPPRVEVMMSVSGYPGNVLRTADTTLTGASPLADLEIGFDRPLSVEKLGAQTVKGAHFLAEVVQIVWENPPPGARPIVVQEIYWPEAPKTNGNAGRPTIELSTAGDLPAGARLRLHLDRTRITNAAGDPLDGPEDLFVETPAFSVRVVDSDATVGIANPPTLIFNNRTDLDIKEHVKVTDQGVPLRAIVTSGDPGHSVYMLLGPGGVWPHPGRYEVTIDAGAADDFGQALPAPATLSFEVR